MQFNNTNTSKDYVLLKMTRTIRVHTTRMTQCGPYKVSQQAFTFSKRFTVTKTFSHILAEQQQFGKVLSVLVLPLTVMVDLLILLLCITLGSSLLSGVILFFIFLFIPFLFIKSIVQK